MSGYLLASQGDRMLMANSVEGRFPFLDQNVVELADSLPPAYKLRGLDETGNSRKKSITQVAKGADWFPLGPIRPGEANAPGFTCSSRAESGPMSRA